MTLHVQIVKQHYSTITQTSSYTYMYASVIPRLHDDSTVRNGSAWHGTERLSSNVYTRLWLCGREWFLKSNSVINYNHCQKSKWMPCLQPSVQSRKGGIRCTNEGERLFSRNIRNIMAMAIQYTSNGLCTDLVVHQLIFFPVFQLHLHRFLSPNLYHPFVTSNPPF